MKDNKFYDELVRDIQTQGGIQNWANFGCRLGFFNEPTDCVDSINEMISHYNELEQYELSMYFQDQLLTLSND